MSVDAGSISSSVRIKLDLLNADIASAKTAFDNLGTEFARKSEQYSNTIGKNYKAALHSIAVETKNIEAVQKAGALTEQQALTRLISLRKEELKILQDKAVKDGKASDETVAAIKKTEAALTSLQDKQKLLGDATGSGGLAGKFAMLRDVMLGPIAVAKEIMGAFSALKAKTDEMENAYAAQADALALLNNTLRSTGAGAWTTSEHLQDVAASLQSVTKFGDENIERMQAVLLGFRNIQGVNFDHATEAILDMATVMDMDLTSAAQAVGKALDNPIEGIDSLSRQGFKFTAQEKEMLKTLVESGKIMEAQSIILAELDKTYGGAARSVGELDVNLREKLKNAIGDVNEEIGRSISRGLAPFRKWWLDIATSVGAAAKAQNDFIDAMARMKNGGELTTEERISALNKEREALEKNSNISSQIGITEAQRQGLNKKGSTDRIEQIKREVAALTDAQRWVKQGDAERAKQALIEADEARKKAATEKELQEFVKRRTEIEGAYADKVAEINRLESEGFIDAKEAEKERADALNQNITALNELYQTDAGNSPNTLRLIRERIAAYQELTRNMDENAAQEKWNAETVALAQKQQAEADKAVADGREKAAKDVDALTEKFQKQTDKLNDGSESIDEYINQVIQIAREYGVTEEAIQKLIDAKKKFEDADESKKNAERFEEIWTGALDAVKSVTDSIVDIFTEAISRQMEALDEWYAYQQELLEYDGKTKREALEDELAAAVEAGDEELVAEKEKDLAQLALEEEYNKKRAQLQYEADMAEWLSKLLTLTADTAIAIGKANSLGYPANIPAMIFAAGVGTAQTIALTAAKPVLQAATGGIVLPQSGGVPVNTAENGSAELLLNDGAQGTAMIEAFAQKIVAAMNGGASQEVKLVVDGREMAKVVTRYQRNNLGGAA